jgi:catechol 2,3-dioxygenase-like lactoylglutathione lyase family enzyme
MSGEFRAVWFARDYDAAVAFYRNGLELPVVGGWDRASDDKGTLFGAASGIIEVIVLHDDQAYEAPTGVGLLVEVDDVDATYARLATKRLTREPPATKPWGHRQFTVTDPDGVHVTLFSQ